MVEIELQVVEHCCAPALDFIGFKICKRNGTASLNIPYSGTQGTINQVHGDL